MTYRPDPPTGYMYVPLGNRDITEYCKEKCRERNLEAHIVSVSSISPNPTLILQAHRQNPRARHHQSLQPTQRIPESTHSELDTTFLQR